MYILYENETAVNVRLEVKTAHMLAPSVPRRGVGRGGEGNLTGGCHLGASEVQTPLTGFAGAQVTLCGPSVTVFADGTGSHRALWWLCVSLAQFSVLSV